VTASKPGIHLAGTLLLAIVGGLVWAALFALLFKALGKW
jgi:hypothetical protein